MELPIRVLLVEDHLVMRAALRLLLSAQPTLLIVGETADCQGALDLSLRLCPDVIVLDLFLANGSSLECIPDLVSHGSRVLILTGADDESLHARAFALGARGVVRKEQPAPVLIEAIQRVRDGHRWHDPALPDQSSAPVLFPLDSVFVRETTLASVLTPREREVIQLLCEGLKNKQLAARLCVSEKTVHNHLASIFRKLEVSDRLALAAFARRHNLL